MLLDKIEPDAFVCPECGRDWQTAELLHFGIVPGTRCPAKQCDSNHQVVCNNAATFASTSLCICQDVPAGTIRENKPLSDTRMTAADRAQKERDSALCEEIVALIPTGPPGIVLEKIRKLIHAADDTADAHRKPTNAEYRKAAREQYSFDSDEDHITIDDDARVARSEEDDAGGAFVQAWVWTEHSLMKNVEFENDDKSEDWDMESVRQALTDHRFQEIEATFATSSTSREAVAETVAAMTDSEVLANARAAGLLDDAEEEDTEDP